MMKRFLPLTGLASAAIAVALMGSSHLGDASSHREAPAISQDPVADATDVYAFVSPDDANSVTFVLNYVPIQAPSGGPNFYRFGDDVLYELNIDNNGDAIEDITYQFRFRSDLNPANAFGGNTFLYNTGEVTSLNDADLNQRQFYSVSRFTGEGGAARQGTLVADNLQVAPYDVGPKSFPGNSYTTVANQAIYTIGTNVKVFAGPRDDPFFLDLGGIFDLLNVGTPEDYLAGINVHSIVIQIPKNQLTANGSTPTQVTDPNAVIGIRTTAYRQGVRVLRELGGPNQNFETGLYTGGANNSGPWIQVSRLDIPLINEVIVPLKDKNRWNGSRPKNDTQFLAYVTGTAPGSLPDAAPHLAALLQLVLGVDTPPAPRQDLVDTLLLGVPGLNRPANVVPSSQLRLNIAVPVTASPNKQGVLANDLQGFPNGRRLADDIVDIELAVVAGCLIPAFAANCTLSDGVNANDKAFLGTFPYLAAPHDYED